MGGEDDGKTEEQGQQGQDDGAKDAGVSQAQDTQQVETTEPEGLEEWRRAVAERDAQIEKLNAEIAEAAKSVKSANALAAQIEKLRADSVAEREEFELRLAGVRNVVAGRALLAAHKGDVAALREAEPWLFDNAQDKTKTGGVTGLPSAGAATDEGRDLKRWRAIAGLDEE